ncbi:MAG: LysE family translocator [Spirochaetales bacterium]|nr:LysE family translocator [Spirochaetales bacterium]
MPTNLFSLALYVVMMTATPGPNNMLVTATGARFGHRSLVPLIAGMVCGVLSQLLLCALGLGLLFERFPQISQILEIAGSVFILYLAWKIAFSQGKNEEREGTQEEKPAGFFTGFGFQYFNPKVYVMTLTTMAIYPQMAENYWLGALMVMLCFALIAPFGISLWGFFGTVAGKLLEAPGKGKRLRLGLGLLTAASVIFLWI